jgi:uncharacterized protein
VTRVGVLVMAKSPVAGQAKTRLAADIGDEPAADVAAAALVDTLGAVARTGLPCVVAWSGLLAQARHADEVAAALRRCLVVPQRGDGFAGRLAAAHHDAAGLLGDAQVVQIGMDTPQVTADHVLAAAAHLRRHDAALGIAADGGWWALAVRAPDLAAGLATVPMSRQDTGARTLQMLVRDRASVGLLEVLRDVDTVDDAQLVAQHPTCGRRFASAATAATAAMAHA